MPNDNDDDYIVYTPEPAEPATGWFVGIIVALALVAIGYLVFSTDFGPQVTKIEVSGQ